MEQTLAVPNVLPIHKEFTNQLFKVDFVLAKMDFTNIIKMLYAFLVILPVLLVLMVQLLDANPAQQMHLEFLLHHHQREALVLAKINIIKMILKLFADLVIFHVQIVSII